MRPALARVLLSISISIAAGCGGVVHHSAVAVRPTGPDLVYAGPGVRVIPDYDEAIFFSEGSYWWFLEGAWYRSPSYTGGWVHVVTPPAAIVQLQAQEPHRYRHYRPIYYVAHNRPIPLAAVQRPVVRDPRGDRK
jgi:hypothetical protein